MLYRLVHPTQPTLTIVTELRLLYDENKASVVLYVAIGNVPAEKVYHNVGFSGLMGTARDPSLDDEWLEIGFEGTDLGHW